VNYSSKTEKGGETNMADTSNRGLGSDDMDEQTKQDIQSKGGQSSPQNFANNPDLAREAGSKGGQVSGGNYKNDPQRASETGRKGGQSRSESTDDTSE
jgi:uncharacterized protein